MAFIWINVWPSYGLMYGLLVEDVTQHRDKKAWTPNAEQSHSRFCIMILKNITTFTQGKTNHGQNIYTRQVNSDRIWEIQTGWTWYGRKFPAHQSQETDLTRRFVRYASDFISCKKGAQKTWDTVIRTNYQLRINTPLADCWCTDALVTKSWQYHSNEIGK